MNEARVWFEMPVDAVAACSDPGAKEHAKIGDIEKARFALMQYGCQAHIVVVCVCEFAAAPPAQCC